MLTTVHRVFDNRIFYKECKTLVNEGFEVTLIAQHTRNESISGVKIVPLPKLKNKFHRMSRLVYLTFFLALKEKADVYHFHDPELITIGALLRIFSRKYIIYDVHEDVPSQILYKEWIGNIFTRKFVSFLYFILQSISFLFFHFLIAATPEITKKLPRRKTITLCNFPILEILNNNIRHTQKNHYKKPKAVIIYSGGLSRVRGIKEIIKAMEFVQNKAELWLLGPWEEEQFRLECESIDGWKRTKYIGFVKPDQVFNSIEKSDIGLVNFLPLPNHMMSMPNKPFEYMACGLPMVMSDFPYWKKLFDGCALFVNPEDPRDIAEKIVYLLNNRDLCKKLGKEGRRLVEEKYNWELESKKLTDLYSKLSNP